jgi:8-oxo-dGTP pyrophosphatase MutT (NUDIX family)
MRPSTKASHVSIQAGLALKSVDGTGRYGPGAGPSSLPVINPKKICNNFVMGPCYFDIARRAGPLVMTPMAQRPDKLRGTPILLQADKTLTQVAALPYFTLGTGIEILLVTSRRRGRWILPRGWPAEGKPFAWAAAREAKQEAGAIGRIAATSIGDYGYQKRMDQGYRVPCRVFVYPLQVTHQRLDWREKGQRDQRWSDPMTAAALIRQKGLAEFLTDLARWPDLPAKLDALVENDQMKVD